MLSGGHRQVRTRIHCDQGPGDNRQEYTLSLQQHGNNCCMNMELPQYEMFEVSLKKAEALGEGWLKHGFRVHTS